MIATSACPALGAGFVTVEDINKEEAGPLPPSISREEIRIPVWDPRVVASNTNRAHRGHDFVVLFPLQDYVPGCRDMFKFRNVYFPFLVHQLDLMYDGNLLISFAMTNDAVIVHLNIAAYGKWVKIPSILPAVLLLGR